MRTRYNSIGSAGGRKARAINRQLQALTSASFKPAEPLFPPGRIVTTFPPATNEQLQAELHAQLTSNFKPDEAIWFYPLMAREIWEQHRDDTSFPKIINGRSTTYLDRETLEVTPFKMMNPYSITLKSKFFHKSFPRLIQRLRNLNDTGYEIFICPNPLGCSERNQRTVIGIRFLAVDPDDNSIEDQYAFLENNRSIVQTAVFSGNRSVQMMFRIAPISNAKNRLSWKDVWLFKKNDWETSVTIPKFDQLSVAMRCYCLQSGIKPDKGPLGNFATLVRAVGFKHRKTGHVARLVYCQTGIDPAARIFTLDNSLALIGQNPNLHNIIDSGFPSAVPGASPKPFHRATIPLHQRSFIDDLDQYWEIRATGIPARGQRLLLHHPFMAVARIFNWTDQQLATEWRNIVAIQPDNIGCSVEESVADILDHWHRSRDYRLYLPELKALSALDKSRIREAQQRLRTLGCDDYRSISRIIGLLYEILRRCPRAAIDGVAAIQSGEMQAVSVRKRYLPSLQWLSEHQLLQCTDRMYYPGQRSRLYRISPVILWILGFKTSELTWKRKAARVVSSKEGPVESGSRLVDLDREARCLKRRRSPVDWDEYDESPGTQQAERALTLLECG